MPSNWTAEIGGDEDDDDDEPKTKAVGMLQSLEKSEDDFPIFTAVLADSDEGQGVAVTFEKSDIVVFVRPDPDDPNKVIIQTHGRENTVGVENHNPPKDSTLGKGYIWLFARLTKPKKA